MSVEERILAACCGDREQARLVEDMLARRIKPLNEPGVGEPPTGTSPRNTDEGRSGLASRSLHVPGSLSGFSCPNCLREWPEPFCDECGRQLEGIEREGRQTSSGLRHPSQKEATE